MVYFLAVLIVYLNVHVKFASMWAEIYYKERMILISDWYVQPFVRG
jgi:hypothetical protein